MPVRPGGELATRPLHFIWIVDCSGSMNINGKIQELNFAIKEALPHMKKIAEENPFAQVFVRAITFSSGAQWHIPVTPLEEFSWVDLSADGVTDLGRALTMVADELKIPPMTERALPPVLVLVSDGQPTDDYASGLKTLMDQPWGKKAVRIAIAIGQDADYEVLQKFIGNPEVKPLQANNPETLVKYIRWVSTAVLKAASAPASQPAGSLGQATNVPIEQPDQSDGSPDTATDVW
ncbi:MAG: VWA domain-containing protein [Firmicutes bacterium]|nr:VWA domain-containing protein [Bacillota bacterium]